MDGQDTQDVEINPVLLVYPCPLADCAYAD